MHYRIFHSIPEQFPEAPPKLYSLKVLPSVLQETIFPLVENHSFRAMIVTLSCKVYLE